MIRHSVHLAGGRGASITRWTLGHTAFFAMKLEQLKALLGKGDIFISQDLQSNTLFGDYRVDGAVMNVERLQRVSVAPDPAYRPSTEPADAKGQQDCRPSRQSVSPSQYRRIDRMAGDYIRIRLV